MANSTFKRFADFEETKNEGTQKVCSMKNAYTNDSMLAK